jgi:hypothetical protein
MSFNFSINFGYLTQNHVYNHNSENAAIAQLATTHTSGNIRVKLYPRWYKHIAVEWSIPADWGACLFNVYFSQTEDGPFEKLNSDPIDGTSLTDTETEEFMRFNRGFYVVEAILLEKDNVTIRSLTTTWETGQRRWVELRSDEIQRREWVLLNKFVGIKTYIFRRKSFGERCPECWSAKTEKSIKSNCKTCVGTTFKGGYFPAVSTLLQYDATPNSNIKTYFGIFEPNQISAWTIAFPEMRPDDIIIRVGDWNLYRIERITNSELQGRTVRQIMLVTQLAKSDIEYELTTKNLPDFPVDYI